MRDLHSPAGFAKRSLALGLCSFLATLPASAGPKGEATTTTPIKHVVVIFQENRSFDQYFATYPYASNLPGENPFHSFPGTPTVNGLLTAGLLNDNPNSSNPQRLSPAQAIVCSDSHDYTDEQNAFDHGLMDMFPEHTADSSCPLGQVVDYFDGNTVTALWNYAQHFAMSDKLVQYHIWAVVARGREPDFRADAWCRGFARRHFRRCRTRNSHRRCGPSV